MTVIRETTNFQISTRDILLLVSQIKNTNSKPEITTISTPNKKWITSYTYRYGFNMAIVDYRQNNFGTNGIWQICMIVGGQKIIAIANDLNSSLFDVTYIHTYSV